MEEKLGLTVGKTQPFLHPATGTRCKTCVLVLAAKSNHRKDGHVNLVRRLRSYSVRDPIIQGSVEERNCPIWKVAWIAVIWKVAWIAVIDPKEARNFEGLFSAPTLGNDHENLYRSVQREYCKTDREAFDEMKHLWESVDDSCFVSIESMRREKPSDTNTLLQVASESFHGPYGIDDRAPRLPEVSLPESATLYKFGSSLISQIGPMRWEDWSLIGEEFREATSQRQGYTRQIEECALRLLREPIPVIGMC